MYKINEVNSQFFKLESKVLCSFLLAIISNIIELNTKELIIAVSLCSLNNLLIVLIIEDKKYKDVKI